MSYPADYIVVVSNEDDFQTGFHHFSEKVNRKMRAGYQLLGHPFAVERLMCQAMVKPAGLEGDPVPAASESTGDTTMFYHRTSPT
jgi:hypothetical protein